MSRKNKLWREDFTTALQADLFDLDDWFTAKEGLPQLEPASIRAASAFVGQPTQDAFLSLYKRQPHMADPTPLGLEPLADLLQRGMETPNWQRLRETSVGDRFAAGVGSLAFVEDVLRALPNKAKKAAQKCQEASQEAQANQGHADNLHTLAEMLQDRVQNSEQSGDEPMAGAFADQAAQALAQAAQAEGQAQAQAKKAAKALGKYKGEMDSNAAQVLAAMNDAAGKAQDEAQQAQAVFKGFCLAAGGDPQAIDPTMAQAAMRAMRENPNLYALAEMLGWARRAARGEWRKSSRGRQEFVGYKVQEIHPPSMAPVEWTAMVSDDPALALDWERRAIDGGLRHRQFEGEEQMDRGELVVVTDQSGSMTGTPHALAVGLEWALLEIARRDNRAFYSVPFSGRGQLHVWQAPKPGKPDPKSLMEHMAHFYGGGTDIYPALLKAIDLVNSKGLRADILVITDDSFASAPPEFLTRLAEVKTKCPLRIETVVIGAGWNSASEWSDRVTQLSDFVRDREQLKAALSGIV